MRLLPSRNNDAHRDPPLDLLARPSTTITAGTLERPHRGLSESTKHRNSRKQGSQHRSQPSQKRMEKTQCRLNRHSVGEKMAGDRTCGSVVIWIREPMAVRSPPWRAHSNRSSNVRDAENWPWHVHSKRPEMRAAYPKLKCLLGVKMSCATHFVSSAGLP